MKLEVELTDDGFIQLYTKVGYVNIGTIFPNISISSIRANRVKTPRTETRYISKDNKGDVDKRLLYKEMPLCHGGLNFAIQSEETNSHQVSINQNQQLISLFNIINMDKVESCIEREHGRFSDNFIGNERKFCWAYATSLNTFRPGYNQNYIGSLVIKELNKPLDETRIMTQFFIGKKDKNGTINIRVLNNKDFSVHNITNNGKAFVNKNWCYSACFNALEIIKKKYPDEKTKWKRRGMK